MRLSNWRSRRMWFWWLVLPPVLIPIRLRELAERCGCDAYLIDGADDIQQQWIANAKSVGVTAGASAPEVLVSGVLKCSLGCKATKGA